MVGLHGVKIEAVAGFFGDEKSEGLRETDLESQQCEILQAVPVEIPDDMFTAEVFCGKYMVGQDIVSSASVEENLNLADPVGKTRP